MEVKPKPCKGMNKAFGVSGCGIKTPFRKHGLCMKCYAEFIMETDAGKVIMQKAMLTASKIVKTQSNQVDAKKRNELKTLSELESEAKKSFQKFIRLRDKDLPCISCGNSKTNDWCGSHYFAAGTFSGMIFNENNCHKACNTYCNKHLSGNLLEYRKGLILRYGSDYVADLELKSVESRNYKYTRQELIDKKIEYDHKIKDITK